MEEAASPNPYPIFSLSFMFSMVMYLLFQVLFIVVYHSNDPLHRFYRTETVSWCVQAIIYKLAYC